MTRSPPPTRSRCSCQTSGASSRPTVSRACCTRSGGPATSFVRSLTRALRRASARVSASFDRLPIRVRLAGVSALLTFVILCAFAIAIGSFTVHRIRSDFNQDVLDTADQLRSQLNIETTPTKEGGGVTIPPSLVFCAAPADHAVIRIFALGGGAIAQEPARAPSFGAPQEAATT